MDATNGNASKYQMITNDMNRIEAGHAPPHYSQTAGMSLEPNNAPQPQSQPPPVTVQYPQQLINGNPPVGPHSTELNCPNCRCRISTRVTHRSTSKTHIACLLLSWTLCCCCLPYCMDSCRNANHFCPMCGAFIGTYSS